jgi:hypothetical protein
MNDAVMDRQLEIRNLKYRNLFQCDLIIQPTPRNRGDSKTFSDSYFDGFMARELDCDIE